MLKPLLALLCFAIGIGIAVDVSPEIPLIHLPWFPFVFLALTFLMGTCGGALALQLLGTCLTRSHRELVATGNFKFRRLVELQAEGTPHQRALAFMGCLAVGAYWAFLVIAAPTLFVLLVTR